MITSKIISLPRNVKRLIVLSMDLMIVPFSLWCSYSLRLGEFFVPEGPYKSAIYLAFLAPVIAIPIFIKFGLYHAIIRYIGFMAMWAIVKAVSLYTLVFGLFILLSGISGVPRSVILINWLILVLLVGCSRACARWWLAGNSRQRPGNPERKKVIIYGAGSAGIQIATAFAGSSEYSPVAFIDDNRSLQGNYIHGLRVYSFSDLSSMIERFSINEVILAMPSVRRSRRKQIISKLEPYAVHVTTLPGMDDIASGKVKVEDLREVGVRDLLGRDPVEPDQALLHANVKERVVMVTGAGGSIGSELCRQIIRIRPRTLILFERNEHGLYLIEKELLEFAHKLHPEIGSKENFIVPILASMLNQDRFEAVCKAFNVETIYHAAAYKHVPMVEKNPIEALRNNVLGTYRAAMAAIKCDVDTFVLISTDKAVRPTSTMGATKRFAEMILQGLAGQPETRTRFSMVRFGNVLASSGSVVPLFRDQIRNGGPVTVTEPRIIRYFMTIPEAAQLVIQAGAMAHGGEVFVLDMGEPIKILDLATRMIHLSGLEIKDQANPDGDIEIVYTGLRPGEKLYEELLIDGNVKPTQHPLIMAANEETLPWSKLCSYIEEFVKIIDLHDVNRCRALLLESIKEFSPQCDVADLVQERRAAAGGQPDNVIRYPGPSG